MGKLTKKEFIKAVKDAATLMSGREAEIKVLYKHHNNSGKKEVLAAHYPCQPGVSMEMDDAYRIYLERGGDIDTITEFAGHLLEVLEKNAGKAREVQAVTRSITDYKTVKTMLRVRLVNAGLNREALSERPHIPFLDLAAVFCLEVYGDESSSGSVAVTCDLFKTWGMSLEQVYQDALANMQRENAPTFKSMASIMQEIVDLDVPDLGLYVLSNEQNLYGAASILCPEALEKCAEAIGGDFCILPSSVHEVILCGMGMADSAEDLGRMIQEINGSVVSQEEVLSDHPYYYSTKEKKVTI